MNGSYFFKGSYKFANELVPTEESLRVMARSVICSNNLSIEKISKECGLSKMAIQRWLKGKTSVRYKNLEKMLAVLSAYKSTKGRFELGD